MRGNRTLRVHTLRTVSRVIFGCFPSYDSHPILELRETDLCSWQDCTRGALSGIEINSDEEACTHIRIPDAQSLNDADCIRRIATKLAGPAAQLRFENRSFTEQELEKDHRTFQDLNEGKRILQQYWTRRGERNDGAFYRQLAEAETIAHNLVEIHWGEVEAIVAGTRETGRVEAERARSIVRPAESFTDYLAQNGEMDNTENHS